MRGYLHHHRVHLAVVLAFAIYPLVYGMLTGLPTVVVPGVGGLDLGATFDVFLPQVRTMVVVLYVGLFAMSFDFVSGYTGYLSFGHAMFYGTGAYLVVLAANGKVPGLSADTPFVILLVVGAILAAVVALVVGLVSFRLTGVYFAMITLGFAEVAHVFVRDWNYVGRNPSDGPNVGGDVGAFEIGVPYVDSLSVGIGRLVGDSYENVLGTGIDFSESVVSFYAVGVVVLLCYFALQRIVHSPFGRVMVAIRENEERARAVGYNTYRFKLAAFAISAFFAAVAGALFAGFRRSVAPETTFDLFVTADALLAAIIGGFGTLAGALYGHLFHESLGGILSTESDGLARYLRETLPADLLAFDVAGVAVVDVINVLIDGRAELYLGIVFILFVLYVPQGLLGTVRERLGGPAATHLPPRAAVAAARLQARGRWFVGRLGDRLDRYRP